jgi:hypothetical protein
METYRESQWRPHHTWVREIPLVRVVGTQQKIANPALAKENTEFHDTPITQSLKWNIEEQ